MRFAPTAHFLPPCARTVLTADHACLGEPIAKEKATRPARPSRKLPCPASSQPRWRAAKT
eukprot:11200116-Lingulodinium_polyedra.AAC.1